MTLYNHTYTNCKCNTENIAVYTPGVQSDTYKYTNTATGMQH